MFEVMAIIDGDKQDMMLMRDVHGSDAQVRYVPEYAIDRTMMPVRFQSYRRAQKAGLDCAPRGSFVLVRHVATPLSQRRDVNTGRMAGSTKQIGR